MRLATVQTVAAAVVSLVSSASLQKIKLSARWPYLHTIQLYIQFGELNAEAPISRISSPHSQILRNCRINIHYEFSFLIGSYHNCS